jgi:hypothetical protein
MILGAVPACHQLPVALSLDGVSAGELPTVEVPPQGYVPDGPRTLLVRVNWYLNMDYPGPVHRPAASDRAYDEHLPVCDFGELCLR